MSIRTGFLRAMVVTAVLSACSGSPSTPTTTPTPTSAQATVVTVTISGTASLTAGQVSQFTATARMSDSTMQNVTSSVTWQSSNAGIATVSGTGLVTGVAIGTTTITATSQGKSGTLEVTVSTASVTTTFEGTLAGTAGQSGTFAVSIETTISASAFRRTVGPLSVASASGNLTLVGSGGTSALTGTFDISASTLNLSGGGFVLTGAISQDAVSGSYLGPNNSTGEFAGLDASHSAITRLCGTGVVMAGAGMGSVRTLGMCRCQQVGRHLARRVLLTEELSRSPGN